MIIGLGTDVVNIQRIEKSTDFLEHFKHKILGAEELHEVTHRSLHSNKELACLLGKYYAGKEAFAKALGTGFIEGIFLRDIQILHNALGKPMLKISGAAVEHLHKLCVAPNLHISLSDDYPYAMATVIIEK
ncbi:MAG: holo-ACP synthase [Alphaproteobacteria bacterium]|nr:holo-ACP synthase [Alphaproteobacteria bacterium]